MTAIIRWRDLVRDWRPFQWLEFFKYLCVQSCNLGFKYLNSSQRPINRGLKCG